MMGKYMILFFFAFVACAYAGVVPAAVVAPYASSYNAHVVNHAVAAPIAPYVAAPYVAAPYVAAPAAPIVAAPAAYANYVF